MSYLQLILCCALIAAAYLLGRYEGKYGERTEWNKLIKEGRLPHPKQRNQQ